MGTISANGEREIGELIAKAMERVGKEGVITVEVRNSKHVFLATIKYRSFSWQTPSLLANAATRPKEAS